MSGRQYHWTVVARVDRGGAEQTHTQTVATGVRSANTAKDVYRSFCREMGWEVLDIQSVELQGVAGP